MTEKGFPGSNEQQAIFKLLVMPRICTSLQSSRSLMFCVPPDTCSKNVYNLLIHYLCPFHVLLGMTVRVRNEVTCAVPMTRPNMLEQNF